MKILTLSRMSSVLVLILIHQILAYVKDDDHVKDKTRNLRGDSSSLESGSKSDENNKKSHHKLKGGVRSGFQKLLFNSNKRKHHLENHHTFSHKLNKNKTHIHEETKDKLHNVASQIHKKQKLKIIKSGMKDVDGIGMNHFFKILDSDESLNKLKSKVKKIKHPIWGKYRWPAEVDHGISSEHKHKEPKSKESKEKMSKRKHSKSEESKESKKSDENEYLGRVVKTGNPGVTIPKKWNEEDLTDHVHSKVDEIPKTGTKTNDEDSNEDKSDSEEVQPRRRKLWKVTLPNQEHQNQEGRRKNTKITVQPKNTIGINQQIKENSNEFSSNEGPAHPIPPPSRILESSDDYVNITEPPK